MASARDNDLVLRSSSDGSLIATETLTLTLVGGAPGNHPVALEFVFPILATGTTPDCTISAEFTDSGKEINTAFVDTVDETNTPAVYVLPLPPTDATALSVSLTLTGTLPVYGEVEVYVIRGEVKAKTP